MSASAALPGAGSAGGVEDDVFEIVDYTCASPFEYFIADVEKALREWKVTAGDEAQAVAAAAAAAAATPVKAGGAQGDDVESKGGRGGQGAGAHGGDNADGDDDDEDEDELFSAASETITAAAGSLGELMPGVADLAAAATSTLRSAGATVGSAVAAPDRPNVGEGARRDDGGDGDGLAKEIVYSQLSFVLRLHAATDYSDEVDVDRNAATPFDSDAHFVTSWFGVKVSSCSILF